MKIDIRKSEKENVRALLFSNNPDLNEKLLRELAFDNYQFNSDGTVDCTITEDDPLMDGYATEGSVKISYVRLDIDKFLTGVLGGKIFPITVNTKEEVIDYLNEKEIMITSTISNVILNKNQEGRLEEIYISIKNDSLCYHGEVRLIPNLPCAALARCCRYTSRVTRCCTCKRAISAMPPICRTRWPEPKYRAKSPRWCARPSIALAPMWCMCRFTRTISWPSRSWARSLA